MADLPSDLRTIVRRYGGHVLDDWDGLRSTLNDFLDEDSSPGDVNLLVDAVRFGSLERLRALLGQGAEPAAALTDAAEGLAQRRGGDAESAYWACAVLGYAADLLPADLVPGTWERPSSLLPPTADAEPPPTEIADTTYVIGQTGPADTVHHEATTETTAAVPGVSNPPPGAHVGTGGEASPTGPASARSRGKILGVAAAVLVLIAGAVWFALTRSTGDMHHGVPVTTVTVEDSFGHFGDPATMDRVLQSECADAASIGETAKVYKCNFRDDPTFGIIFDAGDPVTVDQKGLPDFIQHPHPGTIVRISTDNESLHAYYIKRDNTQGNANGKDHIRDTSDDVVRLILYDVDQKHAGSATFESNKPTTTPLTRDQANRLLQAIGAPGEKFPVPRPFDISTNPISPLRAFALNFVPNPKLSPSFCVEGFLVVPGEIEHVTCFDNTDPLQSTVTTSFGLQDNRHAVRAGPFTYYFAPGSRVMPWHDSQLSGKVLTSTQGGTSRLFWYSTTRAYQFEWGLLSAKTTDHDVADLLQRFEALADHPQVG